MKKAIGFIFLGIVVCAILAVAQAIPGNSLKITPYAVEQSVLAQVLDVKMWKFRVKAPKTDGLLNVVVEARKNGKAQEMLDLSFSLTSGDIKNILIALYPVEGSLQDADKLRFFYIADDVKGESTGIRSRDNCFKVNAKGGSLIYRRPIQ